MTIPSFNDARVLNSSKRLRIVCICTKFSHVFDVLNSSAAQNSLYNVYTSTYIIIEKIMNLQIAKWGNSLALRIPAEYVRYIGIREGDSVRASLTTDGGLSIRSAKWDRKAFTHELIETRDRMPMSESVIEALRHDARY